ncbi:MAG TPA: phosphatidate cytidylyltransferase [Longimicrobiales bacterium]|nr:phosphatidate cytidylyltransferase [Longimicrobiales bacterium]
MAGQETGLVEATGPGGVEVHLVQDDHVGVGLADHRCHPREPAGPFLPAPACPVGEPAGGIVAPRLSPAKTWEGLLGGLAVTVLACILVMPLATGHRDSLALACPAFFALIHRLRLSAP